MILGENYGSVSDIEIVWVLLTGLALIFSLYNMWASILDYRYLRLLHLPPNGRKDQAEGTIIAETARTMILLIFLSIGIIAMTLPEAPPNLDIPRNQEIASILIRWGLIASAVLIAVQSVNNARIRRRAQLRARTRTQEYDG